MRQFVFLGVDFIRFGGIIEGEKSHESLVVATFVSRAYLYLLYYTKRGLVVRKRLASVTR